MNKKGILTTAVIAVVVLIGVFIVNSKNSKQADEIYQNFIGTTFRGQRNDDGGFASGYIHGNLDQYKTYYDSTDIYALFFNEDGTVDEFVSFDKKLLAYPQFIDKPQNSHVEDERTYDSFSIYFDSYGEPFIELEGGTSCPISIDENNVPHEINDYYGIDLIKQGF